METDHLERNLHAEQDHIRNAHAHLDKMASVKANEKDNAVLSGFSNIYNKIGKFQEWVNGSAVGSAVRVV